MDIQSSQWNIDVARMSQLSQRASATGAGKLSGYKNPTTDDEKKMRDVANDFEAVFVKQMLDAMDKTVDRENGLFSGSDSSEAYFRDMMYDETAKSMTKRTGGSTFGLAESIYRELAKQAPSADASKKITMGDTLKMGTENAPALDTQK